MAGIAKVFNKGNVSIRYSPGLIQEILDQITNLVNDVELLRAFNAKRFQDGVVNVEFAAAGGVVIAKDANPEDIQTTVVIPINHGGTIVDHIPDAVAVVATQLGTGKTIGSDSFGYMWVYNRAGHADLQMTVPATVQAELTDIAALAQAIPAPPAVGDVPIGVIMIEADTSIWEWGHATNGEIDLDSDTATIYDFLGVPRVYVAMASFALDAAAATFTYGAANAYLGDGTQLVITGKANVAFPAGEVTAISNGDTGAFVLFCLADDDEIPLQIGAAYGGVVAAKTAVQDLRPNPLLVKLGEIYITNNSGADFTPGTTNLDATGITVEFVTEPAAVEQYPRATDLTASALSLA